MNIDPGRCWKITTSTSTTGDFQGLCQFTRGYTSIFPWFSYNFPIFLRVFLWFTRYNSKNLKLSRFCGQISRNWICAKQGIEAVAQVPPSGGVRSFDKRGVNWMRERVHTHTHTRVYVYIHTIYACVCICICFFCRPFENPRGAHATIPITVEGHPASCLCRAQPWQTR